MATVRIALAEMSCNQSLCSLVCLLQQALDKGLDEVQMRMLFSPKHHYKVNEHGKVDFSRYNFENCLMKMIKNEAPDSSKTSSEQSKKETSGAHAVPALKEEAPAVVESEKTKAATIEVEVPKPSSSSASAPTSLGNDFHARIERFLADTNARKEETPCSSSAEVKPQSVLCDDQKKEILDFVKQQLPEIVEAYLKSKDVSVVENQPESEVSFNDAAVQSCSADDVNEITTDESISVAPSATVVYQVTHNAAPREEIVHESFTGAASRELPYHIDFLFHEIESAKFTVLSGCLFHKLWCVRNSGLGVFCKDAYVTETSCTGFGIATSHVPDLKPGEVGNIVACVKAPETPGLYELEFKVVSGQGNEFIVNTSLGFTVSVIDDAVEYARSLKTESESCAAEVGSEVVEDEDNQEVGNVECEDSSQDKDFSSMCEDETVIDEDHFGSTDDEMEMIEDFTFIPLPDCFDLNRIPAMQSTSEMLMSSRGSRTNSESRRDTEQVTTHTQQEKCVVEDCHSKRDRRVSEMSAPELVEPPVMVDHTLTNEMVEEDSKGGSSQVSDSMEEQPEEKISDPCDATNDQTSSAESTAAEKDDADEVAVYEEAPSSSCDETEVSPHKYISPSVEKELLQKLNSMGFCDKSLNREALLKNDFDFNKALEQLIADFEPLRRQ